MASFKIFAALLIVCVAQQLAYADVEPEETPEERSRRCSPHVYEEYRLTSGMESLFNEYKAMRVRYDKWMAKCSRTADQYVEKCLKDAAEYLMPQKLSYAEKTDSFLEKLTERMENYKQCALTL